MKNPYTPAEVRWIRTSLGYNQSLFAKLLGVGSNTVSRWERGEKKPVFYNCGRLAHFEKLVNQMLHPRPRALRAGWNPPLTEEDLKKLRKLVEKPDDLKLDYELPL